MGDTTLPEVRQRRRPLYTYLPWIGGVPPTANLYQHGTPDRVTFRLVLAAIFVPLASLLHGYNSAVLNTQEIHIVQFFNKSYHRNHSVGTHLPADWLLNFLWSSSQAIYLVAGIIGASCVYPLTHKFGFGSKNSLVVASVINIIAALLYHFCKTTNSKEMFMTGRFVAGIGCGAGSGLVPLYMTEVAPVNLRGAMGVVHQFHITIGILLAQFIGLHQLLGSEKRWPFLLAFTASFAALSFIVLLLSPNSPQHLLHKGDHDGARQALRTYRSTEDVEEELNNMMSYATRPRSWDQWSVSRVLKDERYRLQLILVIVLALAQQLSGINVLFYYSRSVFESEGVPNEHIQYAVLSVGIINVISTGISIPLMDKCGRRPLLFGGIFVMVLTMPFIAFFLLHPVDATWIEYFSITLINIFVIGFAIGLGSIPQFIAAELFEPGPQVAAMTIGAICNWLANVTIALFFPQMNMGVAFLTFFVVTSVFGIFTWYKLPETKGKTYSEIMRHFRPSLRDNNPSYLNRENMPLSTSVQPEDRASVPDQESTVNGSS